MSHNNPLTLTIVIPAYNEENYLNTCLDAIARQTTPADAVIVVDNNSTDRTAEIAKQYPFVTLLHEKQQGVVYARDKGFNAVKTDIIGRIDSDTVLPPDWVATVKRLLQDPAYAAVNGPVSYYDMPLPKQNYWLDHQFRKYLYLRASTAPFLFGSNSALRRETWESIKSQVCHASSMHEDLDLAIHVRQGGYKILYDKALLAGTSARRYDDKLGPFRHYMSMYLYTYRHHHIYSLGPRAATTGYWLGYILLNPARRAYDPKTGKRTFRQFMRGHRARKNPSAH